MKFDKHNRFTEGEPAPFGQRLIIGTVATMLVITACFVAIYLIA